MWGKLRQEKKWSHDSPKKGTKVKEIEEKVMGKVQLLIQTVVCAITHVLNEFMSKGKSEQLKPQYEKTEDKGVMAITHRVVRQSNQKSLNQVTKANYNLILVNIVNS